MSDNETAPPVRRFRRVARTTTPDPLATAEPVVANPHDGL